MSGSRDFLLKAHSYLIILGGIYVGLVGLLSTPYLQRQLSTFFTTFLQISTIRKLPSPRAVWFSTTVNLKLHTSDNETLGAWFILSDEYYHSLPSIPEEPQNHIETALRHHPTVLFFHGNAATRAFHVRIQYYKAFTSRLGANVLAIDYRGFADSTGQPSEAGLIEDGLTAFTWLTRTGARAEDILIIGHSLGTGVASQLVAHLDAQAISCRGVVFLSPFSSIREVLNTYHIFGFLPLIKPISMIPWASDLISWALVHRFDTLKAVPDIKSPVLIAHAEDDWDIPHTHSDVLFEAFLDPLLPSIPMSGNPLSLTVEEWNDLVQRQSTRSQKRKEYVKVSAIPKFGTVSEIRTNRIVVLVKTLAGAHDYIGVQEGLQDVIGHKFGLLSQKVEGS